ncbi:MAG: GntR family transcriptional regulator [Thermodesulfobacteriota bacterium]
MGIHPPSFISDQIYEHLKEKIICGDFRPGERLKQIPVAKELKISRLPIRDAFRRLEQDELLERLPQGGVRVTIIKEETIKEVFEIRKVLEAYALKVACSKITEEEINFLKDLRDQAQGILDSKELSQETKRRKLFELNSRFHELIYRSTGSTYLLKILSHLRNIVSRLRYLGLRTFDTWREVWEEHSALIDYLEKRDKKGAVKLIKKHLNHASNYVLSSLRKQKMD